MAGLAALGGIAGGGADRPGLIQNNSGLPEDLASPPRDTLSARPRDTLSARQTDRMQTDRIARLSSGVRRWHKAGDQAPMSDMRRREFTTLLGGDPPVGGHSCNGGMIARFHRAVCDQGPLSKSRECRMTVRSSKAQREQMFSALNRPSRRSRCSSNSEPSVTVLPLGSGGRWRESRG
jgi:hypothetical protein